MLLRAQRDRFIGVSKHVRRYAAVGVALLGVGAPALAQLAPVLYQGQLKQDGVAFNGPIDVRVRAYSEAVGGVPLDNQWQIPAIQVTDGLFEFNYPQSVNVAHVSPQYLQIEVRPANVGNFTVLEPRQVLGAASHATALTGVSMGTAQITVFARNGTGNGVYALDEGWQSFIGQGGMLSQIEVDYQLFGNPVTVYTLYRGRGVGGEVIAHFTENRLAGTIGVLTLTPDRDVRLDVDTEYTIGFSTNGTGYFWQYSNLATPAGTASSVDEFGSSWACRIYAQVPRLGAAAQSVGPWDMGGTGITYTGGRVGIGVTNPTNTLDIGGRMYLRGGAGTVANSPGVWFASPIDAPVDRAFFGMRSNSQVGFYGASSGWTFLMDTSDGYVSLGDFDPANRLELPNTAGAGGTGRAYAWVTYSSAKFKENVRPIDGALDRLMRLNGVFYDWKKEYGGTHDVGFIAQEVFPVLPEVVHLNAAGEPESIDYARITALAVEAIKEQQCTHEAQRAAQDATISRQQEEIAELRERLEKIEAALRANE